MESDINGDEGRYPGLDVNVIEDEIVAENTKTTVAATTTAIMKDEDLQIDARKPSLEEEVEQLRCTVSNQAKTIRMLQDKLTCSIENPKTDEEIGSDSKKRKRGDPSDVMNLAMVEDSFNKDEQIRELRKEIDALKHELRQKNETTTKINANKSILPKPARALPPNPPLQNVATLIKDLKKSVEDKITAIESSLDSKLQKMKDDINKTSANGVTFASIVSGEPSTPVSNSADFRTLMRTTRNEEITEEKEKERKKKNLIVHGCKLSDQAQTAAFVNTLFKDVGAETISYETVNRIGKEDQGKRPIIVELSSENDKDIIMRSLKNLKGNSQYKGISITEDYTVAERELIKNYRTEAKDLNARNECEDFFFSVRGTPKNGLFIKKIKKVKTVEPQSME